MKVSKGKNVTVKVCKEEKRHYVRMQRMCDVACKVLRAFRITNAELSICLVSNRSIRKLNRTYKGRNAFTDVLAFPIEVDTHPRRSTRIKLLGEVIISLDETKKNARRFHTTFERELLLYVIHGILHILGYDDEVRSHRIRMERKQQELFQKIVIKK